MRDFMKKLLLGVILLMSFAASASTVGVSSFPFVMSKHVITTEFNSYLTDGSGMGLTAKYLHRFNEKINVDAGFGFTDGDRSSTLTAGIDTMIIPDYGRQPRVSVKTLFESAEIDSERYNSGGIAPTLSKGFIFWGKEAYPYLAVPYMVQLNTDEGTYETTAALTTGVSGKLDLGSFKDVVGNLEINMPIRNSFSAFVMGISIPIQ